MTSHTIIPTEFYYLVTNEGRERLTTINWDSCSKRDVRQAIISHQFDGTLIAVHAVVDGKLADVSEDMAADVLSEVSFEYEEIPSHLRDFIDEQLGAGACDGSDYGRAHSRTDRQEHSTLHRAAQGV